MLPLNKEFISEDGQGDQPRPGLGEDQVFGRQPRASISRPKNEFTLVKKRGIITDGLVQRRLDKIMLVQTGGWGWARNESLNLNLNDLRKSTEIEAGDLATADEFKLYKYAFYLI